MTRDALSRLLFDMLRAKKREATADYRWRQAGENGDQAAARDEAAFVDESVLAVLAAFDEANRNTEAVQRVRGLIAEFSNDVSPPKSQWMRWWTSHQ